MSAAVNVGAHTRGQRATARWSYAVLVPFLAVFLVFNVYPVIRLFLISGQDWSLRLRGEATGFSLVNFQRLFDDDLFLGALRNTLMFTAVRVPLSMAIGLLAALAISHTKLMRPFYTVAWFSPFMTSVVAMALVFSYIYDPTFGLANFLLEQVGLDAQGFLQDPAQALYCIVLVDIWKTVGFNMVVFMSGLSAIPDVYGEAARVDGAGRLQIFRWITLPLLSRTTYLLIIMGVISSMRVFVPVYMMSGFSLASGGLGGPLNSTNVMTLYMYQAAFRFNDFGRAAACAVVLFVMMLCVTIVQFRMMRTKWEY